jgi:hypothetical protein
MYHDEQAAATVGPVTYDFAVSRDAGINRDTERELAADIKRRQRERRGAAAAR